MKVSATAQRNNRRCKERRLGIVLLAAAIIMGECASVAAEAPKTSSFVLSEDVRQELNRMETPMFEGQLLQLSEELKFDEILTIKSGEMLFNKQQGFYAAHIKDGGNRQPIQLLDKPAIAVSENGRKALYGTATEAYILDIDSGKSKKVQTKSDSYKGQESIDGYTSMYFADKEGRYVVILREVGVLAVADTATDAVYTIMLKDYLQSESYGYRHDFKVYQNELYMFASVPDRDYDNLIKINLEQLRFETVLSGDDLFIGKYELLSDGKLLFDGQFREEDGIFLYDPVSETFRSVLSEPDVDPGRFTYAFSLSPDEGHILIHNVVNENVELAEFKEGKLLNKRFVMKGYSLHALIWLLTSWNEDGNDLYIKLAYEDGGTSSGIVSNIVEYTINE